MRSETCLYRHFDKDGRLLYVGITDNIWARLARHRQSSWAQDIARIQIDRYKSKREAGLVERHCIRNDYPVYNRPPSNGYIARRALMKKEPT